MAVVGALRKLDTERGMTGHIRSVARRHESAVTMLLLAALLLNLLAVGYVSPPSDALERELPMAAQCQGGGPGCVEQPMIPPPAVGLPRIEMPLAISSEPALLAALPLAALHDPPMDDIAHPPLLAAI
jgi:hypothetical protein